jgi:hypothetical protein
MPRFLVPAFVIIATETPSATASHADDFASAAALDINERLRAECSAASLYLDEVLPTVTVPDDYAGDFVSAIDFNPNSPAPRGRIAPNIPHPNPVAGWIFDATREAMQRAEEMHGDMPLAEYATLMNNIAHEAVTRAEVAITRAKESQAVDGQLYATLNRLHKAFATGSYGTVEQARALRAARTLLERIERGAQP